MGLGKFITFEGGEGSGKSTQLSIIAQALERQDIDVLTTREPGGTEGAELIRDLLVNGRVDRWPPMAEALLHFSARVDHVETVIKPALEAGIWVLCDRFFDSTVAYQGGGHGLGLGIIEELQKLTLGGFVPDLTVILDIPVEPGLARAFGRAGSEDRYERMDIDFHRRIRQAFLDIARENPTRCGVVNAEQSVEKVEADIVQVINERLAGDLRERL